MKYKKIFVVCPAHIKSGGPELLHQLVYTINKLGGNAIIAYFDISNKNKDIVNPAFRKYIASFIRIDQIEDSIGNMVIVPEVRPEYLSKFKRATTAIWWLSVDNYLHYQNMYSAFCEFGLKGIYRFIFIRRLIKYCNAIKLSNLAQNTKMNFAQSVYAMKFLEKEGFKNIIYLSDYLGDEYSSVSIPVNKKDYVLYNPRKENKLTKTLRKKYPTLNWKPIENLTSGGVRDLMRSSKVYIDFGSHPGKDRIPREAALCGCCIITGKKGSAKFYEDIGIPDKYKFIDSKNSMDSIYEQIVYCIHNYPLAFKDFEFYREQIMNEKQDFVKNVCKIFF